MNRRRLMSGAMLAVFGATAANLAGAATAEQPIAFTDLDTLLKQKPLLPGGPSADIVASELEPCRDRLTVGSRQLSAARCFEASCKTRKTQQHCRHNHKTSQSHHLVSS